MTHEAPRPETYHTPEGGLFNVAAMSDAQIIETGSALYSHVNHTIENYYVLDKVGQHDRNRESGQLLSHFLADVRGMGNSDPGRLRELLTVCVQGEEPSGQLMAVETVDNLLDNDYTFARDMLVDIHLNRPRTDGRRFDASASEEAMLTIGRLMRDRLTQEQMDDFNAVIVSRAIPGYGRPIDPASPDRPF